MSQDCRVLALSHESPDFISESCDTNCPTALHLQKRRHRQKEQAESRAKAMRRTEQGTRPQQRHLTARGQDERERAGTSLPPKSPAEETSHTTNAKHLTQHARKNASCLLALVPISGNRGRTRIRQSDNLEENRSEQDNAPAPAEETAHCARRNNAKHLTQHARKNASCLLALVPISGNRGRTRIRQSDNLEENRSEQDNAPAPAEETAHCARRNETEAGSVRIRQEKNRGAGEPEGERCLSGGRAKMWVRKCSAHPNTAPEGYPTAVATSWTLEASEESGNRGKYTESDIANGQKASNENSEAPRKKTKTKKTQNAPDYFCGEVRGCRRCHCPTDDAPGFEARSAGSTRGHAHCPEDREDDTRTHVINEINWNVINEINWNVINDTPATRPARNFPKSTTLARVASRPRPPPKGDAEG